MGRPRKHDPEALLDHARRLWAGDGVEALTLRSLSDVSGVSNGAIYHAFGSRDGLLAAVWAREAERFVTYQRAVVDQALSADDPVGAVLAAAAAPAGYARHDEDGARLLLSVAPESVRPSETDRERHTRLRTALGAIVADLARALWGREDAAALRVVRHCVVDLPGALLLSPSRVSDPLAIEVLERAVRGVVAVPPPGTPGGGGQFSDGVPLR